jgi:hypothetical protein
MYNMCGDFVKPFFAFPLLKFTYLGIQKIVWAYDNGGKSGYISCRYTYDPLCMYREY